MSLLLKPFTTLAIAWILVFSLPTSPLAQQVIERPELESVFSEQNVIGTFVLFDVSKNEILLINRSRALKPVIPASTFKIANALIALETKVVRDENEVIPYGGRPQRIKSWERDMSMRDGITISNVPVFQELAARIGVKRYKEWLKRLDYGNGLVGSDVKTFWLDGSLKISAVEQVKFLAKLAQQSLPASKRSQIVVADIIKQETKAGTTLYGKTGWTSATTPELGWFVGWVESEQGSRSFAMNMDMNSKADARKPVEIAKIILKKLFVF